MVTIMNTRTKSRWRSSKELHRKISRSASRAALEEAFSLSLFFMNSLKKDGYVSDPSWADAILLTPYGETAHALLVDAVDQLPLSTAKQVLFLDFYHHELYVDVVASDLNAIWKIADREIRDRKLLLPSRFGRELYEKFNATDREDRIDHLTFEESTQLLQDATIGVYQVGTIVSGPLGLIRSPVKRLTPPSLSLPLWHCADVGCQTLHEVELLDDAADVCIGVSVLQHAMNDAEGPCSEWHMPLRDTVRPDHGEEPFSYTDLGPMVADSIHASERTALLVHALASSSGSRLRAVIGSPPRRKSKSIGSAEDVCGALSESEQLQLLHLLSDADLVTLIDGAVRQQAIRVPPNEVRKSKNIPRTTRHSSELSSLGVRCAGKNPLVDLCSLIWEAYTSTDKIADLEWRLRLNVGGTSTRNALLVHLCKNDPSEAVKELVLSSAEVARYIATSIGCPLDQANDSSFIDRVLWKLGFDIPRYSEPLQLLRQRLEFFNQELLSVGTLQHERDRERIRSAGVNLFVSVESFLQELIRYNVWVLSCDHFVDTRFVYNTDDAMDAVADALGSTVTSGSLTVHWDSTGDNTLGTLLVYLQAALKWIKSLPVTDRSIYLRDQADLPHYHDDKFRVFPFKHKALWADSDYSALQRIADNFEAISNKLARSNLAEIRNGLDHQRDEARFPSIQHMLAFAAQFREGLDTAEVQLYYPKELWILGTEMDRYRRRTTKLLDYSGRPYVLYGPSVVHDIQKSLNPKHPVLIAPGSPLGFVNSEITFRIIRPSTYSQYWSNYPSRRTAVPQSAPKDSQRK